MLEEYKDKESISNYSAAMDAILRANEHFFRGGMVDMCKALDELLQPRLEQEVKKAVEKAVEEAVEKAVGKAVEQTVEQKDKEKGQALKELQANIRENLRNLGMTEELIIKAVGGSKSILR